MQKTLKNTILTHKSISFAFCLLWLATSQGFSANVPQCPQIKCEGASIILDSSVQITGVLQENKFIELVETSTATTPSANHVRIYAVGIGSYTVIRAIFDDGTVRVLANN